MDIISVMLIFAFCLIGCGISSWYLGKQKGIHDTVAYMIAEGFIIIKEEEDE